MVACIIDHGRGPEVASTRVTIYRIIDLLGEGSSAGRIATDLHLTEEQVRVELDYIAVHRRTIEADTNDLTASYAIGRYEIAQWDEAVQWHS